MKYTHTSFKALDMKLYALSFYRYGICLDLGYHCWRVGTWKH